MILSILVVITLVVGAETANASAIKPDQTSPYKNPSLHCINAAKSAAHEYQIPASVLIAITLAETGRTSKGTFQPWPWTTNVEGKGRWFESRKDAERYIQTTHGNGKRSFDVGCFQINFKWHSEAFQTPSSMLDPDASARYAAQFIKSLFAETGDWGLAAGLYHSRTPRLANKYRTRFERIRTAHLQTDALPPEATPKIKRELRGLPLAATGQSAPGSLFSTSELDNLRFVEMMAPRGNIWDE